MILQRLVEHYDRLEASGDAVLAQPGMSQQKISFCVVLNPDCTLNAFEDMRRQDGKTLQPRTMIVPGQGKPSGSGLNPCFLWDNAEYLLGWTEDPVRSERAERAFTESKRIHLALQTALNLPAYDSVCAFLQGWTKEQANEHAARLREVATHFGVYRIAGQQQYVHQLAAPSSPDEAADAEVLQAMCLVTGSVGTTAKLHKPPIKGVANTQTSGALLVSFNATAFESYGRSQSHNAPVGAVAVFKYANALNHLLQQRGRRIGLATPRSSSGQITRHLLWKIACPSCSAVCQPRVKTDWPRKKIGSASTKRSYCSTSSATAPASL